MSSLPHGCHPIPDWPAYYAASDGHVWSTKSGTGRQMLGSRHNNGYRTVKLRREGEAKRYYVHRLICAAFHGSPPTDKHEAAHADGSRDNNEPNNLRWATHAENQADKSGHGTLSRGEQNGCAKLTAEQVREIRALWPTWEGTQAALGERYGVGGVAICDIVNWRRWAHLPRRAHCPQRDPALIVQSYASRNARLTPSQVLEIRAAYAAGEGTHAVLGAKYGGSRKHIGVIVRGGAWRHL